MLSDCVKCWETPCECGHGYRNMPHDKLLRMADAVIGELERRGIVGGLSKIARENYELMRRGKKKR